MLDGGDDDGAPSAVSSARAFGKTEDGEVVALGPARGEGDVRGTKPSAQAERDVRSGSVERTRGLATKRMKGVGIGSRPALVLVGRLCSKRLRPSRCARGVVEVCDFLIGHDDS